MSDKSILYRIESAGGEAPRLRLRALEEEEAVPDATAARRYERIGEIARGGIGVVYRGHDTDLGRDVALKVLREAHLESPEIVRRFVEEAQIGGQLQHPGIVPVYELGLEEDRRPFFAMKLVKGETFASMLDARAEPSEERRRVLSVFEATCRTVAYAHSRGVVHRDLKPANVMIGAFGEVQVVDWGFAKVLARGGVADERRSRKSKVDVTRIETVRSGDVGSGSLAGSVFGTPAYMPPEQALGHVDDLDERSDVFALGAILTEILTGSPPYPLETKEAIRRAARCDLADAEARLDACEADAELVELCRRALSPVPKDRPRNAAVLADAVATYLAAADERAHLARVAGLEQRGQAARSRRQAEDARAAAESQRRKRRWVVGLAVAAGLALLLGGGAWFGLATARETRVRRLVAAIDSAMQEASIRRGAGEHEIAVGAAERAHDLAVSPDTPSDLRQASEDLLAAVRADAEAARLAAVRRKEDETFLGELRDIRILYFDSWSSRQMHEAYKETFRRFGIDLEELTPEEAAERMLARTEPLEIAAALDEWARLWPGGWEYGKKLFEIAARVDPDEWRNRYREAVKAGETDALLRMAEEADVETLPLPTLNMIARSICGSHPEAAIALLTRIHKKHPADPWVSYHLASHLDDRKPPAWDEAIRYSTAALAARPDSAGLWEQLGVQLSGRGDHEDAVVALRRAVALRPGVSRFHRQLGGVLTLAGRDEEAIQALREAIRLAPGDAAAYASLASALAKQGRIREAEDAARKAVELDENEAIAWANLGRVLREQHRIHESIEAYGKAVALDPDEDEWHSGLGGVLCRANRIQEALEAMRRATELAPWVPRHQANLAYVHSLRGEHEEALVLLRRAIALDPGYAYAHGALAGVLLAMGDTERALRSVDRAIALDAGRAGWHDRRGLILKKAGRYEESEAAHRKATELEPEVAAFHVNLGAVLCDHLGRVDEAIAEFEKARDLDPRDPDAWHNLGQALTRKGDRPRAIDAFERALEIRPVHYGSSSTLGVLLYEEEDWDGAADAFEAAMECAPNGLVRELCRTNALAAHVRSTVAGVREGDYAGALAASRRALALAPEDALLLNEVAVGLVAYPDEDLRDPEEALRLLEKALRIRPGNPFCLGTKGAALYRLGRYEEAVAASRSAVGAHTEERAGHEDRLFLAMALFRAGREKEARDAFRTADAWFSEHEEGSALLRAIRAEARALLGEGE